MFTQVYLPHSALHPFVKFYLIQQFDAGSGVDTVLTCKGLAAVQFSFKAPANTSFYYNGMAPEDKVQLGEKTAIIGPPTTFGHAYFEGVQNILAVALQPTATQHFIKESALAMTNRGINVELFDKRLIEAQEKLLAVHQPHLAVKVLEPYLIRYFYQQVDLTRQKDLLPIVHHIDQCQGVIKIEDLANHYGISRRWLEKQFKVQVGMTPKAYSRIVRFRNVMSQLYHSSQHSWMQVVAQYDYADQSHFIKDFFQYTGGTPSEHFKKSYAIDRDIHLNF